MRLNNELQQRILEKKIALEIEEEEIAKVQVEGKPANIVDKIVEGKIKAYYDQVCFVCQKYIKDNAKSIAEVVAAEGKKQGKNITVQSFQRWKVGG